MVKHTRNVKNKRSRARGQIIPKAERKFLVRVYLGEDLQGKRKYNAKTITGSRKDAERALTELLRDLDTQTYVEPCRKTLALYLEEWLDSIKFSVSARTWDDYRGRLVRDVVPVIGHRQLSQLTHAEIQRLYIDLQSKGHSPRTVRYTHSILARALRKAASSQLIRFSPTEGVNLPRNARKEMQVLTQEEVTRVLAASGSDTLHALWVLLFTCGLRPGEALGLKWADLDLECKTLRIARALKKTHGDKYEIGEPKTAGSRRTVTLPDTAVNALLQHRAKQAVEILRVGRRYARGGFVFANGVGAPWDISKIRRRFKRALSNAGVSEVRLYDTRHTHATLLLTGGMNPKIVSERLGHTNIGITLDTYSHVLPHMQTEAAQMIDKLLLQTAAR